MHICVGMIALLAELARNIYFTSRIRQSAGNAGSNAGVYAGDTLNTFIMRLHARSDTFNAVGEYIYTRIQKYSRVGARSFHRIPSHSPTH